MLDPVLITGIIVAVLSIPAGAGLWQYLSTRRDRPLREQEVKTDSFEALTSGYAGFVERMTTEVTRLSTEVASQGDQIKELRAEVRMQASVINKLRNTIRAASAWIDDLHIRWDYHRLQEAPPPKPHLDNDFEGGP